MSTIYKQHDKKFNQVSAYVLLEGNNPRGTVAFHYPRDSAGRVTCFLHLHGMPMVKGVAGGYGYDKTGASFENAISSLYVEDLKEGEEWLADSHKENTKEIEYLKSNLSDLKGSSWNDAFNRLGSYKILRAI